MAIRTADSKLQAATSWWRTPNADLATLTGFARGADVLLGATFRGVIDRTFLSISPDLRIVAKYTIGVDDVDLDAATELGVLVTHCPTEANWGGVAEGAVAMILALLKRVRERDAQVKGGGWREPPIHGTYLGRRGDGYPGITLGHRGSRACRLAPGGAYEAVANAGDRSGPLLGVRQVRARRRRADRLGHVAARS